MEDWIQISETIQHKQPTTNPPRGYLKPPGGGAVPRKAGEGEGEGDTGKGDAGRAGVGSAGGGGNRWGVAVGQTVARELGNMMIVCGGCGVFWGGLINGTAQRNSDGIVLGGSFLPASYMNMNIHEHNFRSTSK